MSLQEVTGFLQVALECSIYLAPREPGLTHDEIHEAGKRAGFQAGEIGDALPTVTTQYFGSRANRLLPNEHMVVMLAIFTLPRDPDYRNIAAFDFMYSQFNASLRAEGARNAQLERNIIVERVIAQKIPRHDIEAAITISIMSKHIVEKGDLLHLASGRVYEPLPGQQRNQIRANANTSGPRH